MVFPNYPRTVNSVQEILDLADKYQIPLSRCRFFINQDIQEPRAFGIYNDGINWIVYKNKANGERAIRYQGDDEAYAAQEIWSKFLSEVDMRRSNGLPSDSLNGSVQNSITSQKEKHEMFVLGAFYMCLLWVVASFVCVLILDGPDGHNASASRGYYSDGTQVYYHQQNQWFHLSENGEWSDYDGVLTGFDQFKYFGDYDFENSDYYKEDDSDYDWDTDWDDWDSSDTDWDSDW